MVDIEEVKEVKVWFEDWLQQEDDVSITKFIDVCLELCDFYIKSDMTVEDEIEFWGDKKHVCNCADVGSCTLPSSIGEI